jgi:CheY-like chemotaxis protein
MAVARCKILLVEDDADVSDALAEILQLEGYEVALAFNGSEALGYLRQNPPPCVILLDLMMPIMDGYEFLNRRSGVPDLSAIPVFCISAGTMDERLRQLQTTHVFKKPLHLPTLLGAIRLTCPDGGTAA